MVWIFANQHQTNGISFFVNDGFLILDHKQRVVNQTPAMNNKHAAKTMRGREYAGRPFKIEWNLTVRGKLETTFDIKIQVEKFRF